MRKFVLLACLIALIAVPSGVYALGLELGVGGWRQKPEGDLSYKGESLDIERDLRYESETQGTGRLKVDMPLAIPNIYVMYTPMEFEGNGQKAVNFRFGDKTFTGNVPFYSKLTLDHLDVGLYYGIPLLKTATLKKLNVDLGINVRIIDFKAEIRQDATGIRETKDMTLYVPMIYVGAQLKLVKWFAVEAEARGIGYSGNHYLSYTGRLKFKVLGPVWLSGGWRHDDIKVDEEDIKAEVTFKGPFAELGVQF